MAIIITVLIPSEIVFQLSETHNKKPVPINNHQKILKINESDHDEDMRWLR
jgi:hypothetical protein